MLQNYTILSIAKLFFIEPAAQFYLKQISKKTGIAHTSVHAHLQTLIKGGIVTKRIERRGSRDYPYYLAANTKEFRYWKSLSNLLSVHELTQYLQDSLTPSCIVLFGSYCRAEDTESSDIDFFVQCAKKDIDLAMFEKKLKRKIQLHFKNKIEEYPKELQNSIINGIVLQGYLAYNS